MTEVPEDQTEIEITPEMVAAGVSALCAPDDAFESDAERAKRLFLSMWRVRAYQPRRMD